MSGVPVETRAAAGGGNPHLSADMRRLLNLMTAEPAATSEYSPELVNSGRRWYIAEDPVDTRTCLRLLRLALLREVYANGDYRAYEPTAEARRMLTHAGHVPGMVAIAEREGASLHYFQDGSYRIECVQAPTIGRLRSK